MPRRDLSKDEVHHVKITNAAVAFLQENPKAVASKSHDRWGTLLTTVARPFCYSVMLAHNHS